MLVHGSTSRLCSEPLIVTRMEIFTAAMRCKAHTGAHRRNTRRVRTRPYISHKPWGRSQPAAQSTTPTIIPQTTGVGRVPTRHEVNGLSQNGSANSGGRHAIFLLLISRSHAWRHMAAKRKQPKPRKRWSARVTRESDALDLEQNVFKKKDPKAIARSLKRSAERSHRRKSDPFRSAMSMLTFYMNRAGENLSASQAKVLNAAKDELRRLYGRALARATKEKQAKKRTR